MPVDGPAAPVRAGGLGGGFEDEAAVEGLTGGLVTLLGADEDDAAADEEPAGAGRFGGALGADLAGAFAGAAAGAGALGGIAVGGGDMGGREIWRSCPVGNSIYVSRKF